MLCWHKTEKIDPDDASVDGDCSDESELAPEDCAEVLMHDLLNKREEVDKIADKPPGFRVIVRGGADTFQRFGVGYDYFRAEATSARAVQFCVTFQLQRSASYKISLYCEDVAMDLANAWMAKMQFLLDMWFDHHDDPNMPITEFGVPWP